MADYNIYIHSFSGESNPTTPFQLRGNGSGDSASDGNDSGVNGFGIINKAAAFVQNPDSAIGAVMNSATTVMGKLAPVMIGAALVSIAKRVVDLYVPYASSASGDYGFQVKYNNFFQEFHNFTHPFSTAIQKQRNQLEIKKTNARNEQERLLFGGTIYSSKYGRNLL